MNQTNISDSSTEGFINKLTSQGQFDYFRLHRFAGHNTFSGTLIKVQRGVPEAYKANFPDCQDRYFLSVWKYTEVAGNVTLTTRLSKETMHFDKDTAVLMLKLMGLKWGGIVASKHNPVNVPKVNNNF